VLKLIWENRKTLNYGSSGTGTTPHLDMETLVKKENDLCTTKRWRWLIVALAMGASGVWAQAFPSRPVELIVHTGAGGGGDLFARTVAEIITKEKLLRQPLIVVNRSGGGGAIAFNLVASRRGDPYTLLAVPSTVLLTAPLRSGLDIGLDKFTPLASLGLDLNALSVRVDAPYATLADFVETAKREPNSIVIAFGSFGGTGHYLAYQLEKATGARFKIVSMKGGQAVLSVLGGHVHATTENLSEVMAHVEAKKMRVLGVPSGQRLAVAPALPTLREQGLDIRSGVRRGFAAPAGVPKESAAVLEAMLEKTHQSAAWKDFATRNLLENTYLNGAAFSRYLAERQPEMIQFMKDAGLVGKP
jgi:putative tricarboxylic transport membrane protein